MTNPSRENFLEKKILILDKRLTQVEKFIELRFRGRIGGTLSDNETDNVPSSSKKVARSGKSPKKTQKDHDEIREGADISESRRSLSIRSSERKRQQNEVESCHRKQKPGPASVKKKRAEREAASKANDHLEEIKDCVIRIERTEVPNEILPETTESPRGRTRRVPKRYQDEVSDDEDKKSKDKKKRVGEEALENSVKSEIRDEMVEGGDDDYGDYDFFGEDGPSSPVGSLEDGDKVTGGYFMLPVAQSTPMPKGTRGRPRKEISKRMFDSGANDIEEEWSPPAGDIEDDSDSDKEYQAEKSEKKTSRTTRQKSRASGKRAYAKVDLKELPADMMVNSDPSVKLCNLCNWHFKVEVFDAHLESHARERHLRCPECGKAYYNQFTLKKHMKTHDPAKYTKTCRQCSKPFLHSDKLLAHERYCVKRALENNETVDPNLIEDLKTRSKNTNWIYEAMEVGSKNTEINPDERKQCPHCKKNFKLRIYDRHVLAHTKPKNWTCSTCDKSYHYKHDLARHVAMDHVVTPKCEFCKQSFDNRDELKAHQTVCRKQHRKRLKIENVKSLDSQSAGRKAEGSRQEEENVEEKGVNEDNLETEQNQVDSEGGFKSTTAITSSATPALQLVGGQQRTSENPESDDDAIIL